ncbi:hypothetical protein EDEG_01853 [Edhazardia aedis USNM 41457]|uniref:Uncharacterized protein n=1 Tax=Edhazardia aedis (strain USNM 41457) TaxID=1003232 RepID=J9D8K7_EDHAE|nr:hypothetical protein EDEG_01853 [Edhazardia aedis USNM 41457]|eukprot:EJW03854.1 hypothetical protein EDEG_01853 [Edhazardia aedis USNM 41457]
MVNSASKNIVINSNNLPVTVIDTDSATKIASPSCANILKDLSNGKNDSCIKTNMEPACILPNNIVTSTMPSGLRISASLDGNGQTQNFLTNNIPQLVCTNVSS